MDAILRAAAARYPDKIMEPFDELYRRYGFDVVLDMVRLMGGFTLYIPKLRAIFRAPVEASAKFDWLHNNLSMAQVARKYGFSEKYWRRVLYKA
jgi:Mor family transcriptional regulator